MSRAEHARLIGNNEPLTGAVVEWGHIGPGGAAGVIHQVESATTDCQPNENVEALCVFMLGKKIEARPTWKPMHKQPVYAGAPVYTNGIEEELFKVGFCLPAGPYVTDEVVRYIVESIREAIVG